MQQSVSILLILILNSTPAVCTTPTSTLTKFIVPLTPEKNICTTNSPSETLTDVTLTECALECLVGKCLSFNYASNDVLSLCQLHGNYGSGFVETEKCIYYQKSPHTRIRPVNIARNKPVFVSKPCDLENAGPVEAIVDGVSDGWFDGRCSCCGEGSGEANWFVIDVGALVRLAYVAVYNRDDMYASRMDHFIIGVSDSFDEVTWLASPKSISYQLCGQYPQKTELGVRYIVMCPPPSVNITEGRYVVAKQPSTGAGYFTICEIEVFAYHHR